MKKSEKLLLSALLSVVGILFVIPAVWAVFRGPVADQEKLRDSAQSRLGTVDAQFTAALAELASMRELKDQSLSANASQGALAYQQWLSDLAELVAKFGEPQIMPERITPARDNSYVAVRIRITGTGTIEQLREFLFRFHRARVLHRIANLTVEALDHSARPKLSIRVTAEALSLRDAGTKGATLFPRTETVAAMKDSRLEVQSTEGFPDKAPFEVRIGGAYCGVTAVEGPVWTVSPPAEGEWKVDAGKIVELAPVHPDFRKATRDDFDALVKQNPFRKPVPYKPVLNLIGEKTVQKGAGVELTAAATGYDNAGATAEIAAVGELPPGMTLEQGRLKWMPPTDAKAGDYPIKLRATGAGLKEPLEASFTLALKESNLPPKVEPPTGLTAVAGQPLTFKLAATDAETPAEKLKFALGTGGPEGVTIHETSGEVTWTPAESLPPGSVNIPVQITDDGTPPQTVTIQVAVAVQDNKAPFTFLTGAVAADSDRQAWLYDRSANRRFILREGETFDYAGFKALVQTIGRDFILLQQKNEIWRIEIGQNLKQARVIATAEPGEINGRPVPPPLPETRDATAPPPRAVVPLTQAGQKPPPAAGDLSAVGSLPTAPAEPAGPAAAAIAPSTAPSPVTSAPALPPQ